MYKEAYNAVPLFQYLLRILTYPCTVTGAPVIPYLSLGPGLFGQKLLDALSALIPEAAHSYRENPMQLLSEGIFPCLHFPF
jgi:hypothetical protein